MISAASFLVKSYAKGSVCSLKCKWPLYPLLIQLPHQFFYSLPAIRILKESPGMCKARVSLGDIFYWDLVSYVNLKSNRKQDIFAPCRLTKICLSVQ